MFFPYSLSFLHVQRLQFLILHRQLEQLLPDPLDLAFFVAYEKLVLAHPFHFKASLIVSAHLLM